MDVISLEQAGKNPTWQHPRGFAPIGWNTRFRVYQWPVDEILSRRGRHMSPNLVSRIRRLNPNGVAEGSLPRGWNYSRSFGPQHFMNGTMGPRDFIRRFGQAAYRALPRDAIRHFGHKKAIHSCAVARA